MPVCPSGHESPVYAQFCTTCGQPLQTTSTSTPLLSAPAPAQAAHPPQPDVRTVAVPHGSATPAPRAVATYPGGTTASAASASAARLPGPQTRGSGPAAPPQALPTPGNPYSAGASAATPAGVAPPYRFKLQRLTIIDQITAGATIVLLIALWLPWFGVSGGGFDYSTAGINAHSYLAFALLTSVVLITYLAARAGWDRLPIRPPIAHAPLLLVVGILQFLIVLIAFVSTPNGLDHSAGSYIGLVAAIGASLPIVIPVIQATQQR